MHPITDQDMGNNPMLVQNFHEQHLVPLIASKQTASIASMVDASIPGRSSPEYEAYLAEKIRRCNIRYRPICGVIPGHVDRS